MESGQQPAIVVEPSLENIVNELRTSVRRYRNSDEKSSVLHSVDLLHRFSHDHSLAGFQSEKLFGDGSHQFA